MDDYGCQCLLAGLYAPPVPGLGVGVNGDDVVVGVDRRS